jgi:hypothetical protein
MTASSPNDELAEREVDLARWRRALVTLWWLPVAGIVAGAIVGLLFSFTGSGTYKASALISLGQPVSPGGSVVPTYGTNPRAVSQIVTSASAQADAEAKADMSSGALRGHVSVAEVGTTGAGATRNAPLISLTVQGKSPTKVEDAANALAVQVVKRTTAPYVDEKISAYRQILKTTDSQLASIVRRLTVLDRALAEENLSLIEKLELISEADNAEQRQGNLYDQQRGTELQLAFANQVESAKVVTQAKAEKASAHSRDTSMAIGALIGLILAAIAAIAVDGRARPA